MGAARLEVVAGKAVGTSILVEDQLVIGRQAVGAGRLGDDEEISRSHACVSTDSRGFCAIEDLGSTNGTYVNGLRISSPQTLAKGDTIEMGATTLVVRELPTPEPVAPPASEDPQPQSTRSSGTWQPELAGLAPVAAEPPPPDLLPPTEVVEPPAAPEADAEAPAADPEAQAADAQAPAADAQAQAADVDAEAPAADAEPPAIPPLSLQLEVDFDAREARLFLDHASDPVVLVFDAGKWRAVTSPLTEKGPTHERRPDDA